MANIHLNALFFRSFSHVIYARALITRTGSPLPPPLRPSLPFIRNAHGNLASAVWHLCNVTHSLAYDPCDSRVPYAKRNNNTEMPTRFARLDELCITFSSGLPVNSSKSRHSLVWSQATVRTRMEQSRHCITEIIERQHQHQIYAPRVPCHDLAFTNHKKHAHHSATARVTIEWHYTCSKYVMCAHNLCVRRSHEE